MVDVIKSGIPWVIPQVTCIFLIETTEVKYAVHDGEVGRVTIEHTTAFPCVSVFSMALDCVY